MGNFTELVTWIQALGIPSIFAISVACIRMCVKYTKQIKILMKAQQAQMRTVLLEKYHKYVDAGWVSEEDLEDWENQYQSYHELGKNGIMDSRRDTLFAFPNKKQEV